MNILPSCTLKKAVVADVKRHQSASESNPGDSRKAHKRDSQLTHMRVKCVCGIHPPLYEGKKGIVIRSTSFSGKSSNKMVKIRSPNKLNYITGQIMEQFPNQVKAARELQWFLNKIQKLTGLFSLFFIYFLSYLFSLKKIKNWKIGFPIGNLEF